MMDDDDGLNITADTQVLFEQRLYTYTTRKIHQKKERRKKDQSIQTSITSHRN